MQLKWRFYKKLFKNEQFKKLTQNAKIYHQFTKYLNIKFSILRNHSWKFFSNSKKWYLTKLMTGREKSTNKKISWFSLTSKKFWWIIHYVVG